MVTALAAYLENVRSYLRLDSPSEREVLRELSTHLEERAQELRQEGFSEEEAAKTATQYLGSPKAIAQQMYQVHSQGSWRQALLAAMPHLLLAALFALHVWQNVSLSLIIMLSILGVAAYGWWHGKPAWLFPWLGYCLVSLIYAGLFLLSLPKVWALLALLAYIPLAWWLVSAIAAQAVRRDWLYGSLALLPLPALIGWLVALELRGGFSGYEKQHLDDIGSWIALSFLALAVTAATFIRLRRRLLKTGALLSPEILILMLAAFSTEGGLGFLGLLALVLLSLGILLSPALLERRISHGEGGQGQHYHR